MKVGHEKKILYDVKINFVRVVNYYKRKSEKMCLLKLQTKRKFRR